MLKKIIFHVLILCTIVIYNNKLVCEEVLSISSDRPGQAMTPITLQAGNFQIQSGFYYNNSQFDYKYDSFIPVFTYLLESNSKSYFTSFT